MNLSSNPFLTAIREGRPQIGLWVSMTNNYTAEIVAGAGYDWLVVDMEHSPNDMATVLGQLQAIAPYPSTAIVRPPWNDKVMVKRVLDIGAEGVLFPMVGSVEEAEAAVTATRYPPHGIRGVAGSIRASRFGRMGDYFENGGQDAAVIIQLETRAAIAHATEIAAVDGVDGIFFGPADIAADMGLLGQPMAPAVWDVIRAAARELMAKGIPVGTLVTDPEFATQLIKDGFTFVACGLDTQLLANGADRLLAQMRDGTKEK